MSAEGNVQAEDARAAPEHQYVRPSRNAQTSNTNRQRGRPAPRSEIPGQILHSSQGRPMLRLRNVHPELNGEDLSNLFLNVAPVDFVKFDPRDETVAYVCFQLQFAENNAKAILRFGGKKAMGNTLIVENATSLADRIAPVGKGPRDTAHAREAVVAKEASRVRARKPKAARKPRPEKKSAEDLDAELSAYMDGLAPATDTGAFAAQNNGEVAMD